MTKSKAQKIVDHYGTFYSGSDIQILSKGKQSLWGILILVLTTIAWTLTAHDKQQDCVDSAFVLNQMGIIALLGIVGIVIYALKQTSDAAAFLQKTDSDNLSEIT